MDFTQMEDTVYGGDVENDEELLAELMALQNDVVVDRRTGAADKRVGALPKAPSVPAKRPVPAPPAQRDLDPSVLAAVLHDGVPEVPPEDDDLLDPDLEDELAGLVGPSGGVPSSPVKPAAPARAPAPAPTVAAPSSTNNSQASYLKQMGDFYAKLQADAKTDGNTLKANRYQRSADRCRELQKKAERGVEVKEDDVPVPPPGFKFSPTGPTSSPSTASLPVTSGTAPAIPQRNSSSSLPPEQPSMPAQVPPPVPHRQAPPPLPPRKESVPSQAPTSAAPEAPTASTTGSSKRDEIMSILQRRRNANVVNGKAAVAAKDKTAAMEYVTAAKQFEEAIAAIDSVDIDELDVNDIPPSPRPYRKATPPPAVAPPATFEEGLEARHRRFQQLAASFRDKGEDRKYRMNMRMASQYADALKEARAGRPVEVGELPSLPDFAPLPPQGLLPSIIPPGRKGAAAPRPTSQQVAGPSQAQQKAPPPVTLPSVGPYAPSGTTQSRNANQLEFLQQRQLQFKQAALAAKQAGNMELAKKYMVDAKGFDQMISAARGGLAVNIASAPVPPQALTSSTTLVPRIESAGRRSPSGVDDRREVLSVLEKTLIDQIQLSDNNRLRFTRLGDVGKVRLFEEWAKSAKNDLVLIREVARQNLKVPKFHYEVRSIPSADLFPDLAEDVLELTVISAAEVPLPAGYEPTDANLFVKYVFPYPPDAPQQGKTKLVAGTRSPPFTDQFILQIGSRKSRGMKLMRVLKRTPLKLELYQKGGFLRSDKLLGTGECKLEQLEGAAEYEESAALKDGRKAVGGMVSARIRIREPLGDNKVNVKAEKWLIVDA